MPRKHWFLDKLACRSCSILFENKDFTLNSFKGIHPYGFKNKQIKQIKTQTLQMQNFQFQNYTYTTHICGENFFSDKTVKNIFPNFIKKTHKLQTKTTIRKSTAKTLTRKVPVLRVLCPSGIFNMAS